MPKELTDRQQTIYDFIAAVIRGRGAPPTIRDIMDEFKISSTNGVRTTLAALEKKGHIRRHPRLSRGIELVEQIEREPIDFGVAKEIPLLGRVAAGAPVLATGNVETILHVDKSLCTASGELFALRVAGESMKDVGILDGDIVLARHQQTADRGDIVVALIDDEATVKRFSPEPDGIRLLPENDSFKPIVVTEGSGEFRIAGKVVGLMRQM